VYVRQIWMFSATELRWPDSIFWQKRNHHDRDAFTLAQGDWIVGKTGARGSHEACSAHRFGLSFANKPCDRKQSAMRTALLFVFWFAFAFCGVATYREPSMNVVLRLRLRPLQRTRKRSMLITAIACSGLLCRICGGAGAMCS
jgi:hypothetical protein